MIGRHQFTARVLSLSPIKTSLPPPPPPPPPTISSPSSPMATILPTSNEPLELKVVQFTAELSWAEAGPEVAPAEVRRLFNEAETCIESGRWLDLASLMVTTATVVMERLSEKDLEFIFTVICNLVTKTSSPDEALEMANLISAKVAQTPNDKPALRLKILFNLYNLLENPYSKFLVYKKALNLASSGKVTESIIPSFTKLDNFLQEWNISEVDQRDLYLTITNILKDHRSMSKDSFAFLTKYLATFSGVEESSTMNEAKEEAVRAIIEFVKSPDMFQCDLLDMPAINQLENDEKYSAVYQLLKIFITHRLDSYLDFQSENSTLLKNYGLVHEDCIAKMRLMSLVDLGATGSGEIPYSLIKDTLQIEDNEVECWVVKAITSKLLDCKMDQMNQIVIVSRHLERVFGMQQWQALRSKLAVWRGNVGSAISTIKANKVSDEGVQAMQGLAIR